MSEKVELRPAHTWDCPECGRENFCRGVVWEGDPEELRDAIAAAEGVQPFDLPEQLPEGDLMTAPDKVTCEHCKESFETLDFRQED